jgi:hypothetical protein
MFFSLVTIFFSDGFSSGEYGGIKRSAILFGIIRVFALWNAPLSRMIILNSAGFSIENSLKKV